MKTCIWLVATHSRTSVAGLVVGSLAVLALLTPSCSDSADETAPLSPAPTSPGAGGGPPNDGERVILRDGDWVPPSASFEASDKARAAQEAEQGKPRFDGEVSGFRLYDFDGASKDIEYPNIWCNASKYEPVQFFQLTYVPKGTSTSGGQNKAFCANGSDAFVSQQFSQTYSSWTVTYYFLEKAIPSLYTPERISQSMIQGGPAVAGRPIIPEGNGTSFVAFDLGKGWIFIEALDMPLEETLKIAEGISCAAC